MDISDLRKKTVLVLGAGKTGIASAFFLKDEVKELFLSDSAKPKEEFKEKINKLAKENIQIEFENNSDEFINKADLVVISPGISPQTNVVKKLNSLKVPIISDIELASYFLTKPIVAVTGTNGKTTTTSLITHIINSSGKKAMSCGNIGKPLIEIVHEQITNVDYYILEISSYQMFYSPGLSADIAICLNITSDHLDWHGNFNHYVESKKKLFYQQKEDSWVVLNIGDKILKDLKPKNNVFYFSPYEKDIEFYKTLNNFAFYENNNLKVKANNNVRQIIKKDELSIFGLHNIENSLASIACCKIIDLDNEEIKKGLSIFKGVEHRLEFVKKINGKEFYNDSKATNPEATIKAVEAFIKKDSKKVTLILGGKDKNTSLKEMVNIIKNNVSEVILYGEAKERFKNELISNNYKDLKIVKDLNEAVESSLQSKTDIVLFSPACASFDMFKNYEERGKRFKELLRKY